MTRPTREEVIDELRRHAAPLDLDALVAQGILQKVRGSYEVLDPGRLPEHVRSRATSASIQKTSNGTERVRLKFSKSNAAARLLKRATGEDPRKP